MYLQLYNCLSKWRAEIAYPQISENGGSKLRIRAMLNNESDLSNQ